MDKVTKHTPGPWILNIDTVHIPRLANGVAVSVQPVAYHGDSQGMADARLIAAAPELLAALEAMEDWVRDIDDDDSRVPLDVRQAAQAAIAKARGK